MPMKPMHSLRLGIILFVAAQPLLAADPPKNTPAVPAKKGEASPGKPSETGEQKAARHDREAKQAEAKINEWAKEFPLLTGPGWEEKYGKFRAELAKVQASPEFKGKSPLFPKPNIGQTNAPPTLAQLQQARQDAAFATMRQQADKVLEKHPELRDYIEQQFQWHRRLFDLHDKHSDNPKVRQLMRNRLEVVAAPTEKKPAKAK